MSDSSFSITRSLFVSVPVSALAAWQASWPVCRYCLVYSGISVSSALLTLQDWGHSYRGPCPGHQRSQSERKATERGYPSSADGRGVRHPQDKKKGWPYVFSFCFVLFFLLLISFCRIIVACKNDLTNTVAELRQKQTFKKKMKRNTNKQRQIDK